MVLELSTEIKQMNLKGIFRYGFIVVCCFNKAIAMNDGHNNHELGKRDKIFKCPTIDEIHTRATELKKSSSWNSSTLAPFTLTTREGVVLKAQIDFWNQNRNTIQRAFNLTEYDNTCLIEKDECLKKILFQYSPHSAHGLTLKVDLKKMGINPTNISYPKDVSPTSISLSLDGTKYITFNDPNLIFTIHP